MPLGKCSSPYPNKVCLESSKSTKKVHLVDTHRLSEITSFLDFGVLKNVPLLSTLRTWYVSSWYLFAGNTCIKPGECRVFSKEQETTHILGIHPLLRADGRLCGVFV